MEILAVDWMKPNKFKRHLERVHAEYVWKTAGFFRRKLNEFNKQEQAFAKITTVTPKPLLASFKIAYEVAKYIKRTSFD
jgi:hypothetical protein